MSNSSDEDAPGSDAAHLPHLYEANFLQTIGAQTMVYRMRIWRAPSSHRSKLFSRLNQLIEGRIGNNKAYKFVGKWCNLLLIVEIAGHMIIPTLGPWMAGIRLEERLWKWDDASLKCFSLNSMLTLHIKQQDIGDEKAQTVISCNLLFMVGFSRLNLIEEKPFSLSYFVAGLNKGFRLTRGDTHHRKMRSSQWKSSLNCKNHTFNKHFNGPIIHGNHKSQSLATFCNSRRLRRLLQLASLALEWSASASAEFNVPI